MAVERISVHSLPDLKNTTDDALPTYLNSLKFTQSHTLSDTRLAIGYTSFLVCAACFGWDYTYGFDATKSYTAIAVLIYFVLNSILTFWIFYIEKGIIYIGTSPDKKHIIEISTKTKKHVPIYNLSFKIYDAGKGRSGTPVEERTLRKPFREWFDEKGHFVVQPFQEMVASNIAVVGAVDQKRVVKKEKNEKEEGKPAQSTDEKWEAFLRESSDMGGLESSGADTKGTGAKKRGKKA
ncbi:microsomal signal peptidase 25 kDa subunit protein [Rutstroemia sp. NJR-2017a BBW]|nr:microsomal signal peptidase 25 kDa subunit protein [Rutstroemia sp. NJR-2017a BBW]